MHYCIDILTQVSAVAGAPQGVALGLIEDHVGHCVAQAVEEGSPEATEKAKGSLRGDRPARSVLTDSAQRSLPQHTGYPVQGLISHR
jgi:hypothetical protein